MTTPTKALLDRVIQLCEWISETPHQRGSVNGLAAQVMYEVQQALQAAIDQPEPKGLFIDMIESHEGLAEELRYVPEIVFGNRPAAREPLSNEQISRLWDEHIVPVCGKNGINPIVFARAIEKAHGIGTKP